MSEKYSGNSIKNRGAKEPEAKADKIVQKVVKGGVQLKKKGELSKVASSLISDEITSIKDYAIYEVIIPVIKDTIAQLVIGSVNMIFYGEVRTGSVRKGGHASKVSYSDYWGGNSSARSNRNERPSTTSRFSYDDIKFESKQDAVDVLDRLDELLEQYGVARVADLFELAGVSSDLNPYTNNNYGWTNLRSAQIECLRNGMWIIRLPRASNIV